MPLFSWKVTIVSEIAQYCIWNGYLPLHFEKRLTSFKRFNSTSLYHCSFEDDSVWQRFPPVVCLYQEKKWGTVSYEMFFNVRYQENCYFNGNILQYLKSVMFKFSFLFPWFNQTFDFLISFHSVLRFCILLTSTIGFFQDILGRNEYPFIWFESSCLPSLETSICQ